MRDASSGNGRDAALSRQQPIRPAGKHRSRLPWTRQRPRRVAAPTVAHRTAVCLTAAAATILIGASAAPASAPAGGWSITPSPNPRVPTGQLFWVSCPTAHWCMAVGTYVKASGIGVNLAERWNGTRWSIQATPNPPQGGDVLSGVSCTSASACTAAGGSNAFTPNARTLAEGWDGTRWTIQATPTPAGAQFAFLNTAACASPGACTAAGAYINSSGVFQTLAEHWNGTAWHRQATPNQGPSLLIGLACTSGAACTAVGFTNANQSPAVLVERSAGTTWRTQAAPNPAGAASSHLNGVACTSRSACIAVGDTTSRSRTGATLAERWDGHSWRVQPTPSPAGGGALNSC